MYTYIHIYVYTYIHIHIYIYIYIYIYMLHHVYIYLVDAQTLLGDASASACPRRTGGASDGNVYDVSRGLNDFWGLRGA